MREVSVDEQTTGKRPATHAHFVGGSIHEP